MSETDDLQVKTLYDRLGFKLGDGLVSADVRSPFDYENVFFDSARKKLGVDGIYFYRPSTGGTSIPYIYFRRLEYSHASVVSNEEIGRLHKLAWNMGQAPLLFVVLPDGNVLIYNNYIPPTEEQSSESYTTGLINSIKLFVDITEQGGLLSKYHRSEFDTGRFWRKNSKLFNPKKRADYTLLENLKVMREKLIDLLPKEISSSVAVSIVHSLLGRSIFVKYLEDRRDTFRNNVFPIGFFESFRRGASGFIDILPDKDSTYKLFSYLEDKFNGDIFPVSPEEKQYIDNTHLEWLQSFLRGEERLTTSQLTLWKFYSFDVIPIEFISSVYEEFFHIERDYSDVPKDGTHYTPHHIVELMIDEVMPWDGMDIQLKALDPACGSGIFLVEVYRRLIERKRRQIPSQKLSPDELKELLTDSVFGVDINAEAIRVAAFSLYLTLCDYLEPKQIWETVRFPTLRGKNLFVGDFFESEQPWHKQKYQLIIGNPPWQSELSLPAQQYREQIIRQFPSREIAPDNQIALAFLWRSADLCDNETGEVCLLLPSKGLLFNRSVPHQKFRKDFFESFHVKTVINLSALRRYLFDKGIGPGAIVFFSVNKPNSSIPILYCSPKPLYSIEDKWLVFITPYDIAQLPRSEVGHDEMIWKIAMWGGPRDLDLMRKLTSAPNTSLSDVCLQRGWIHGEGLTVGDKSKDASTLLNKPYVEARRLPRFVVEERELPKFTHGKVQWPRKDTIFNGPHILVKQSPVAGETSLRVALLRNDAVFTDSLVGIHADASDLDFLAACCLVLNSRIALYFGMMSSRKWLIERDELQKEEIMKLPIPSLDAMKVSYSELQQLSKSTDWETQLRDIVEKMYNLTPDEQILIEDAVGNVLDLFRLKTKSESIQPASDKKKGDAPLLGYIETIIQSLQTSFGKRVSGTIFKGDAPLQVVGLNFVDDDNLDAEIRIDYSPGLDGLLKQLEPILLEQRASNIYMQRLVRIYVGSSIYLVKPNEKRFWLKSLALRDADEIYIDVMDSRSLTLGN